MTLNDLECLKSTSSASHVISVVAQLVVLLVRTLFGLFLPSLDLVASTSALLQAVLIPEQRTIRRDCNNLYVCF